MEAHMAHLRQKWHKSEYTIFHEKHLKVLKYYNFYEWKTAQLLSMGEVFKRRYGTTHLKVHLQTFLSIPKLRSAKF
jgi:hypothetical protein